MDECMKFLADSVIAEDKVVTYRLLSRSLKVHVNTAKQMLYEFHKYQNDRRPGTIHATYIIYGVKKAADERNGADGDVEMTSSVPEAESLDEAVPIFSLSLVQEDKLKDALSQYEEVSSIHVYSIGPNPTRDLTLLADAAQEVLNIGNAEDRKNSVTIRNPHVRRRERKGGLANAVKQEVKVAPSKLGGASGSKVKDEPKTITQSTPDAEKPSSSAPAKKPPALKRGGSSNAGIMQAFSKAAAATKVKKEKTASQPATPSGDDSSMQPLSDDGEDDEMPQPKPRSTAGRKTKKEREEELRKMMDELDDEEDEEDKASTAEELEEEPVEEPPAPEPVKEEPAEVVTASGDGRRRGRRRVMQKKQIMDEQGYLITIQEPGWESFSEDEAPPATKPKVSSSAPPPPATKVKKSGPKGSQGSIMSFFSKK